MKRLLPCAAAIFCAALAAPCFADVPPFPHSDPRWTATPPHLVDPHNAIPIVIEAADVEEPTLEIPQKMLKKAVKVAVNTPPANRFAGWPVLAGGALALCFAGGALFVPGMRRKAICVGGLVLVGALLFALRGVPAVAQPPAAVLAKPIVLPPDLDMGSVRITVTDDETARLCLPRKKLSELAKQLKDSPR